MSDKSNSVQN